MKLELVSRSHQRLVFLPLSATATTSIKRCHGFVSRPDLHLPEICHSTGAVFRDTSGFRLGYILPRLLAAQHGVYRLAFELCRNRQPAYTAARPQAVHVWTGPTIETRATPSTARALNTYQQQISACRTKHYACFSYCLVYFHRNLETNAINLLAECKKKPLSPKDQVPVLLSWPSLLQTHQSPS